MNVTVINIRDKMIREDQTFNRFVRPVINPVLSDYCSRLTGIDQNSINTADVFHVVYDQFVEWLREHNFQEKTFAFVCEDHQTIWLHAQYQYLLRDRSMPAIFRQWINITTVLQYLIPERNYDNLPGETFVDKSSNFYNIEFVGNSHNSMDKSSYLAKLTKRLLDDNNLVTVNRVLRCNVNGRRVPLNVDPNWRTTFQSAMLVFGRMLPLVPAVVYTYFTDDDYAKCQYCKNGPDVCTGVVHEQFPYEVYEQLVEPSAFASAARLDIDFDGEDEDEVEDEEDVNDENNVNDENDVNDEDDVDDKDED
ncbi:unnamed protein product [Caenorhabditis nigoni]